MDEADSFKLGEKGTKFSKLTTNRNIFVGLFYSTSSCGVTKGVVGNIVVAKGVAH